METDSILIEKLALEFEDCRKRLIKIASLRVNPMLLKRLTLDDIIQETFLAARKRISGLYESAEFSTFVKLRKILLQTMIDLERKHLASQKRDAFKEVDYDKPATATGMMNRWEMLASSMTSPRTKLAKIEQHDLVRQLLVELPEIDRDILELRHFEALSNKDCAAVLQIEEKTASIRYVRALSRLREKMMGLTGFSQ